MEYYDLIIDNLPNSVAKGCATDISTLNINNATYLWEEFNNYVCACGTTYTGEVTGIILTPGSAKGEVKVGITSPLSNTTVKGIKEFTVTSAPSTPYIEAPNPALVCTSGGSFTLHNVPSGNTITWTSSSNLSTSNPHANPCTFVSTGNGSGWVDATVSTDCVENTFSIDSVIVWSGTPVISYISGPTYTPNNDWVTYYAQPNNTLMGATDYSWALSPLNGNVVYDYGWTADIAFYNSGNYQVAAQAYNQCGWGNYAVLGVEVYDSQRLMFTPNPTTGETTLSIEFGSLEETFDETAEWDMEVYDPFQNLKQKKTKLKGKEYTLNTSGWQEGIYFVRVKYKNDVLTGKLIVQK